MPDLTFPTYKLPEPDLTLPEEVLTFHSEDPEEVRNREKDQFLRQLEEKTVRDFAAMIPKRKPTWFSSFVQWCRR